MNATELRIGNYWTNGHKIYKADANTIYDLENASKDVKVNYKGVEISEKWLSDLGLIKYKTGYYSDKDKNFRFVFYENYLHCSIGDDEFGFLYKKIKYVHQFQNLFFELTNEKLTLNCKIN